MIGLGNSRHLASVLAVLAIAHLVAVGGEPIIVGKEKPKPDAARDSKFSKELSRPFDSRSLSANPMDGIFLPTIPRLDAVDPKKDRKRKLQDLEKKNWMSVGAGELQEEEESRTFLGVREYDLKDDAERDNLMFRDLEKEKPQTSKNQTRSTSQQKEQPDAQQRRVDPDDLQRELDARRAAREAAAAKGGVDYGAHTASELNFKGLLAPPAGNASGGSDFSLKEMLGNAPATQNRNQALRDEFNAFLQGKPGGSPAPAGSSDLINSWRNDMTRQTFNPSVAKAPETKPAGEGFGASAGFGAARAPATFGAGSAFDSGRVPSGIPGIGIVPPVQPPPRAAMTPGVGEINRGFGMNSLGGHNR